MITPTELEKIYWKGHLIFNKHGKIEYIMNLHVNFDIEDSYNKLISCEITGFEFGCLYKMKASDSYTYVKITDLDFNSNEIETTMSSRKWDEVYKLVQDSIQWEYTFKIRYKYVYYDYLSREITVEREKNAANSPDLDLVYDAENNILVYSNLFFTISITTYENDTVLDSFGYRYNVH